MSALASLPRAAGVRSPLRRLGSGVLLLTGLVLLAAISLPGAPGSPLELTAADLGAGPPAARASAALAAAIAVLAAVHLWRGQRRSARLLGPAMVGAALAWVATTPAATLVPAADMLLGAVLWVRLRPSPSPEGHRSDEHERARRIVASHGVGSLDPFVLREDKSLHFAARGVLGFRLVGGTAVVAGDPVGPPGSAPRVLADFAAHACAKGWRVAVTGASAVHLDDYRRLGLRAAQVGSEAVVDPRAFTLEGRAVRKVRQSVTRLGRLGWSAEVVLAGALEEATIRELGALEEEWRRRQARLQGFSMTLGRLWGATEDEAAVYVLGRGPDGALRSFLRFVPYGGGLSLDVMRRLGGEPNGLNEALVVAALRYAAEEDVAEVSLNFAGFAHVMAPERSALPPLLRVLRSALDRAHGRFQLERLFRFNAKFSPTWRPRYALCSRWFDAPGAGLAILRAEAYVRPPRPAPLPQRWTPRALPCRPSTATADRAR